MIIGQHTELERLDTAIKAIWRLYRWGRWVWLEAIGLAREEYEHKFQRFDHAHITSETGLIHRPEQVMALLQSVGPELVDRAIFLIHMYWLIGGWNE